MSATFPGTASSAASKRSVHIGLPSPPSRPALRPLIHPVLTTTTVPAPAHSAEPSGAVLCTRPRARLRKCLARSQGGTDETKHARLTLRPGPGPLPTAPISSYGCTLALGSHHLLIPDLVVLFLAATPRRRPFPSLVTLCRFRAASAALFWPSPSPRI